jgi:hypothetical protein
MMSSTSTIRYYQPDRVIVHKLRRVETYSLPNSLAATHPGFTFYVADPISSIETRSFPNLLVATRATLPSMSLIPSAPFAHGREFIAADTAASTTIRLNSCIITGLRCNKPDQ